MEREASPGRAVGRLLRDQREARGLDLATVEKSLQIRRTNLEAIEEGRFDKLPGAAYIPAFLRAYAAHVGLDPEKVMTAYHLSGPVPIKRPLTLPADFPIVEKRAPIGLAVLTVLLVVGVGYAAWHYLPREQSVVAEKVPPVPDRLLASHPNPAPSTEAQPPAASAPAAVAPPAQPTQEARPAPGNLPPEVWPARREAAAPPPPQPPQGTPLAPPVVAAVPPPPPPPVMMNLPGPGQAQAAQPPAPAEQPRVATAAASAAAAGGGTSRRGSGTSARDRSPPAFRFAPTRPSGCAATAGSSCGRPMATFWRRPMCGPAKATSCRRVSPTASSTPARADSISWNRAVPADRNRAHRRYCFHRAHSVRRSSRTEWL